MTQLGNRMPVTYRFDAQLRGVRFMEVDYPPTQEHKKLRVKSLLGSPPPNVSFVPVDFTKDSLIDELVKSGFSRVEKTFFLWEGVTCSISCATPRRREAGLRSTTPSGPDRNVNNSETMYAKWGEPWLFGFPPEGASTYVQREGLVREFALRVFQISATDDERRTTYGFGG